MLDAMTSNTNGATTCAASGLFATSEVCVRVDFNGCVSIGMFLISKLEMVQQPGPANKVPANTFQLSITFVIWLREITA